MGASQRRKGHGGERELCTLLSDLLGRVVQRHLGQAREGGADIEVGPFLIECKRRARIAGVHDWMAQAEHAAERLRNAEPGIRPRVPVIAFRADGEEWLVAFALEDAVQLMRVALG